MIFFYSDLAYGFLPIGIGLMRFDYFNNLDFSYGIYLFHMPILNMLLEMNLELSLSIIYFYLLTFFRCEFELVFL